MNTKNTFKIALCGVVSALALVLMLITGVFPFGTYAFPCFAGMLFVVIAVEYGAKWGYMVYGVVSILSLFFVPDKEAVLYFISFFGFYPILKGTLERLRSKAIQYILKYLVFNICVITAFYVAKFVLMIPDEEFVLFGVYVPWVFLLIGNGFFICYDMCVTVFLRTYIFKLRDKLFKK